MTKETIDRYMQRVTSIERIDEGRAFYHVGDNFIIDVCRVPQDLTRRDSWINRLKSAGYIPAALPSVLFLQTYFTDPEGSCHGWYNITEQRHESGRRLELNFDYLREATGANERELIAECIRLMDEDIRLR